MRHLIFFILAFLLSACSASPTQMPTVELLIAPEETATRVMTPTRTPQDFSIYLTSVVKATKAASPATPSYHYPTNIYNENRNCNIKGNINSRGERYYHCPNFPQYNRTKINTSEGDRWFCSVDEAIAAGFSSGAKGYACQQ